MALIKKSLDNRIIKVPVLHFFPTLQLVGSENECRSLLSIININQHYPICVREM